MSFASKFFDRIPWLGGKRREESVRKLRMLQLGRLRDTITHDGKQSVADFDAPKFADTGVMSASTTGQDYVDATPVNPFTAILEWDGEDDTCLDLPVFLNEKTGRLVPHRKETVTASFGNQDREIDVWFHPLDGRQMFRVFTPARKVGKDLYEVTAVPVQSYLWRATSHFTWNKVGESCYRLEPPAETNGTGSFLSAGASSGEEFEPAPQPDPAYYDLYRLSGNYSETAIGWSGAEHTIGGIQGTYAGFYSVTGVNDNITEVLIEQGQAGPEDFSFINHVTYNPRGYYLFLNPQDWIFALNGLTISTLSLGSFGAGTYGEQFLGYGGWSTTAGYGYGGHSFGFTLLMQQAVWASRGQKLPGYVSDAKWGVVDGEYVPIPVLPGYLSDCERTSSGDGTTSNGGTENATTNGGTTTPPGTSTPPPASSSIPPGSDDCTGICRYLFSFHPGDTSDSAYGTYSWSLQSDTCSGTGPCACSPPGEEGEVGAEIELNCG